MLWYILLILATTFFYRRLRHKHQYWANRNVKQEERPTFILGDNANFFWRRRSFAEEVETLHKRFPNVRYSGMYQSLAPTLVLHDPELIKQITVKDFDHFLDHWNFIPDGVDDLWSKNMFALKGEKWRDMRNTLSPFFTSSKIKGMFTLISESAEQLVQYFEDMDEKEIGVEMKDTYTRFANDVIATCAFGVKCDSLKERTNEFFLMGQDATDFSGFKKNMIFTMYTVVPSLTKLLNIGMFSEAVSTFFKSLVKDTIKIRKENNIVRPDMIHLLMESQKGRLQHIEDEETAKEAGFATVEESEVGITAIIRPPRGEITDTDIASQALIFFFAGFETTSILMSFLSYELALNVDIQDCLINEIDKSVQENHGTVTYDSINRMKYLDMVVSECLRKWPPPIATDRVCVKPYTIPPTSEAESPIHLNVGDAVWIPIYGIHRDPAYYPDPEKFDPERFNEDNRDNINPYTFIPFGAGPRNCIGSRFALMEVKTVIVQILRKFKFAPVKRTVVPLELSKKHCHLNSEHGFWLSLQKRC